MTDEEKIECIIAGFTHLVLQYTPFDDGWSWASLTLRLSEIIERRHHEDSRAETTRKLLMDWGPDRN